MEEIRRQVGTARRRLVIQQFLNTLVWTLFAGLSLMAIGLVIPKIWHIGVDSTIWISSWVAGSLVGALIVTAILTYWSRRSQIDAAIELDLRYGLKERVSSTLSLNESELESEAGRALIDDAIHRVKRIDVRDEFRIGLDRKIALVCLPLVVIIVSVLLQNADPSKAQAANSNQLTEQAKKDVEEIGKKIIRKINKKNETSKAELKEADLELKKKTEDVFNELTKEDSLDRKKTLMKLNDLVSELEKRRDKLGGADQMKKQMENMKNIDQGPADKIAKAIKDGDLKKAINELKNLGEKMRKGELNAEEKKQLEKQIGQMQQKMQNMVDAHKQAMADLEKQIQQKMREGDNQAAEQLQQKLNQMKMMEDQMKQMQQMADQMGECKECMAKNNMEGAGDKLQQLTQKLQEMQDEFDQLEALDEMLDDVQIAKQACQNCQGNGGQPGQQAQGGNGQQQNGPPGMGMGAGRGFGERPLEENETKFYNSNVDGDPRSAVITGVAGGPNRAGVSREELKDAVSGSLAEPADPISDQRLPKNQFNQAKEYFQD